MKKNWWKIFMFIILSLVVIFITMLFYIVISEFFNSKVEDNTISILTGLIGMSGGIVGAFSAYFIAKLQLTKQIENQEYLRKIELKSQKIQELIIIFSEMKFSVEQIKPGLEQGEKEQFLIKDNASYVIQEIQNIRKLNTQLYGYIDLLEEYDMIVETNDVINNVKDLINNLIVTVSEKKGEIIKYDLKSSEKLLEVSNKLIIKLIIDFKKLNSL